MVSYHKEALAAPGESAYHLENGQVPTEWHGELVEELGLEGKPANVERVQRLANGQHPETGEQLVKIRTHSAEHPWVKSNSAWHKHLEDQAIAALQEGRNVFAAADGEHGEPAQPINVPTGGLDLPDLPDRTDYEKTLIEINEAAAEFYSARLADANEGKRGRVYLDSRAITEESRATFRLGVSGGANELIEHMRERFGADERFTREVMLDSGLFYEGKDGELKDRFKDRLMFPIQDGRGEVIAFAGRRMDEGKDRKYINSPATPLFKKADTLYSLHRAAAVGSGRLVIVEGQLDAIQSHQAGVRDVVALGGANTGTKSAALGHIKAVAHTVVLNLDGNEAGRAGTEKHLPELLEAGLRVRALSLEGDPDKFARKFGPEAYRAAVDRAPALIEWLADRSKEKFDTADAYGKADALRWMNAQLGHVAPERREEVSAEVARYLGNAIEEQEKSKHAERRAGIDIVFSPPKSFSVMALVGGKLEDGTVIGGDERLVAAHQKAVRTALDSMEGYVQARMRATAPETTRRWVSALFLHDTARPVEDHSPNPHLHTHAVVFNLTNSADGAKFASMDPNWLYRVQSYGNAIYTSEMANAAREFGYQLERGKNFSVEIRGLDKQYLTAMSRRSEDIEEKKAEQGKVGAAAGEFVNYETRQAKQQWEPGDLAEQHRKEAEAMGVNPAAIQAAARERGGFYISSDARRELANEALDYAKERLFEGQAVNSHHEIVRDALRFRPDMLRERDIIAAFEFRRQEFITVHHYRRNAPRDHYTTPEMQKIERETIEKVLSGRGAVEPISSLTKQQFAAKYKVRTKSDGTIYEMTRPQMAMAWKAVTSTDQFQIVAGAAGAGKSSSFEVVAEIAEQHRQANFKIVGMAATSSATNNLKDMGVAAHTLQLHNTRGVRSGTPKTLYLLDEGSLVGSQSFRKFLDSVRPQDRVIIAYDHRQHHSVEAGRIIEELELAGVKAIRLEDIMRQKSNPQLLPVIEKFRDSFGHRGSQNMIDGLEMLHEQGRVHEVGHRARRFECIADYYAQDPYRTLIVSPDNRSIHEINLAVRDKLQRMGYVEADAHGAVILTGVRNLKSPDIALATSYEEGNVIRFNSTGTLGGRARVSAGQYATVLGIDAEKNEIRVRLGDAFGARDISYNPRMAKSAEIYESDVQQLAVGDKIRITRNWTLKKGDVIPNNALGRIVNLDAEGKGEILFDEGRDTERTVKWDAKEMPHVRLGYSMTSYSAQSLTVPRAAVHIDTGDSRIRPLLETALLYVGASRPAEDLAIFTDDAEVLLSPTESPILRQNDKPLALAEHEIEDVADHIRVA